MRFGEKCPQCGHPEWVNWRRTWFDEEVDIVEAENVPELAAKLRTSALHVLEEGQWTYYLTRTAKFVKRILTAEYRARGGGEAPSTRRRDLADLRRTLLREKKSSTESL